jgi:uncharacterized flavoprotein (TIGR03862 family)
MKKKVAIIGSGPAALMLAANLDPEKFQVAIYEQNAAPARKFLVAGQGGFNLTHSEPLEQLRSKYFPSIFLDNALSVFSNEDLRIWLRKLNIPTYVGSSKRVFPEKGIKPIEVLNAFLTTIHSTGATLYTKWAWQGWNDKGALIFKQEDILHDIHADISVFALGGGSWQVTGSNENWLKIFTEKGISAIPFQPSNCAAGIHWPEGLPGITEGQALKNIRVTTNGLSKEGELAITRFGLEGGAIYALAPSFRSSLKKKGFAELSLDLKPQLCIEEILSKISTRTSNHSISYRLREQVKLTEAQMTLLKNCTTKEEFVNPDSIAAKIKNLTLRVIALAPIDEAISTVGGIDLTEVDSHFQLRELPDTYCIGEMLDWDAPTGGYLLQACFSMGYYLAKHLNSLH